MPFSQLPHPKLRRFFLRGVGSLLFSLLLIFSFLRLQPSVPVALAANGDLDSTFDSDGRAVTDMGGGDEANAVAQQADGKLVVVGTSDDDFAVARYETDGSLDTSFSDDGKVITDIGGSDEGNGVVIQQDGKIVVAGRSGQNFALARYNPDGSLDTSFDSDGILSLSTDSLGGNFGAANGVAVAIQPDGKIVVAGSIKQGEPKKFALVRFLSDGRLDVSFEGDGFATSQFQPGGLADEEIKAIAIRSDGKIAAVGEYKSGQFALARYNPDGTLDAGFGSNGRATADRKVTTGRGVDWQSDGSVIVVASKHVNDPNSQNCLDSSGKNCEYTDFWVARYDGGGFLDPNFGTKGEVTVPVNARGNDDEARAVAVQADGKIVVAGFSDMAAHTFSNGGEQQNVPVTNDFSLVRVTDSGALDTDFGTGGKITTGFTRTCGSNQCDTSDEAHAILLQSDGKVVLAGVMNTASASTSDFAVARYENDVAGPPIILPDTVLLPDTATTAEESSVLIDVMANDKSRAGFPLTLLSVGTPSNGTATIENGKVRFTPGKDFAGTAYFYYTVSNATPGFDRVQTSVLVDVTPVNDPPTAIQLSSSSVDENLPVGAQVGSLSATDVDAGDTHSFFLLPTGDADFFLLNGNRLLSAAVFDFETKNSYSLRLKVTDSGGASFEQDVTVTVNDLNDAPTAINLNSNRVVENTPVNTAVGALTSTDPDSGDTHTYALVSGAGSDNNGLFTIAGTQLRTNAVFDYELQTAYSVRVRSTDQRGASVERSLVIAIVDLPSPPDPATNALSLCSGDPIPLIDNQDANPNKRVLVQIDTITIAGLGPDGCTVTGKISITSNGSTISNLDFSGQVNARNQFGSSTIPDFSLNIAGITFVLRNVTVGYDYSRPLLLVRRPSVAAPVDWGGLSAPFGRAAVLDSGGFESAGVSFDLPEIKTKGGYTLNLTGAIQPVGNGYEIAADGVLTIPNIGKNKATGAKGQTCGINAGVTIFAGEAGATVMRISTTHPAARPVAQVVSTGAGPNALDPLAGDALSVVRLSEIRVGFSCDEGIPIGNTGLFLTSVQGTVSLRPNEEFVRVEVSVEAGKRIPAIDKPVMTADGTMQIDISPTFKADLSGALSVLSFEIANAQVVASENSVRATVQISAVFIHGEAWIHAWTTDDRFHFTGGGNVTVGLVKGSIDDSLCIPYPCGIKTCKKWGIPYPCGVKICEECLSIPPFDLTLASASAQFGEFTNGRYGFKGWVEVPVVGTVGFYVDEGGDIDFGDYDQYQLIQGPSVAAAHAAWLNGTEQATQESVARLFGYQLRAWDAATGTFLPSAPIANASNFRTDAAGRLTGVTIATPLDKSARFDVYDGLPAEAAAFLRASDVISQVNLLQEADVSFVLQSDRPLNFSLISPHGENITVDNYANHPGYAVTYQQTDQYAPASPRERAPGTARLRFTHASSDASLSQVDVRIDGALLFPGVRFTGTAPLDYAILAPGAHTLEIVRPNTGQLLFTQAISLSADVDYTALLAGSATGGTTPGLSVLTDDNSPPGAYGQARVRHVNGAGAGLELWIDGAKVFDQTPFRGATGYHTLAAGERTVEFRTSSGRAVGQAETVLFAPGIVYTFFTADLLINGQPIVGALQRLDAEYVRSVRAQYGVDQAAMGAWQVEVTGDLAEARYTISLSGPPSPPVLGGVMVDANDLDNAQLGWMVTSDYLTNDCTIYVTPGPITRTVTVTGTNGVPISKTVPIYEGIEVMSLLVDDPNDLGRPLNMGIDISNLPSGEYRMWMRVEDGVSPPVPAYAIDANSARARTITGPDDLRYGVNAARVAKTGYSPLAQLQDAAVIIVDQSASWPGNWNATIRTEFDAERAELYIEWDELTHPDAATYEVLVNATPIGSSQVISAGGTIAPVDAEGKPVGTPVGFVTLPNIDPDQTYSITVRAINGANGSTTDSQALSFQAEAGDYALTAPASSYSVKQGESLTVAVSLQEIQPLLYPLVSLGLDLADAPRGLEAALSNDSGTAPLLSAEAPTATLTVVAQPTLAIGTYPVKIIGYNGSQQRTLSLQIAVAQGEAPVFNLYLPAVTR